MIGVSGGKLAAETCRAGGLGFIAAGHLNSKESLHTLEQEIEIFRTAAAAAASASSSKDYKLAIGFISHSTFATDLGWSLFENVLEDHSPDVVQFFAPWTAHHSKQHSTTAVKLARSYGCQVVAQVGTVKDAIQAMDAGVDCIVAQGTEAGGHGLRLDHGCGTLSLVSNIVACACERPGKKIPILAAGGIMDGKGLMAALSLGADGVVLGTRLWASSEAKGPSTFKNALVEAESADDAIRTKAFDKIANSYKTVKWPKPYDTSGVLRNFVTEEWDQNISGLDVALKNSASPDFSSIVLDFKRAEKDGDPKGAIVYAGKGVGKVKSIDPAFDIVTRTAEEAIDEFQSLQAICLDEEEDFTSSTRTVKS